MLRARIEKEPEELKTILGLSEEWGIEMNAYTKNIHEANLATWSAQNLVHAYRTFADFQSREYGVGALLPLLDIGGESFLETFVHKIINERVEEPQRADVYRNEPPRSKLTGYPSDSSHAASCGEKPKERF